ncbi:DUF2177 family protein [Phenylobacterium sp.]|uniref:DUF2177 family protein n=1 Tax=Phenylobacterium sp. TaxID=1871053 RepID=UPI0018216AFF|nr:DUF2177 family protein [Phenylobacterium sp.]MBA4794172.1 DUF2177 family protein [Phenylobacterium sp.]MBC7167347.1 DUF2177 family protein [Phenylobacterium sp.]
MLKYVIGYLGTGLAFAIVDAVWLSTVGPRLYRPTLDPVLAEEFALAPAIAFYVIYIAGVMILAVTPAVREGEWTRALFTGAVLGFLCYATYDLTSQAVLKVWSTKISVADIAWGTFLTAVSAVAGYFAMRWGERAF